MSLKIAQFLLFKDIKYFDLSVAISNCNFILITERNRTNVVVELASFIKPGNISGAA
jgi:hypothetical protein